MVLLPHGPEPCASANSATSAFAAFLAQHILFYTIFPKCQVFFLFSFFNPFMIMYRICDILSSGHKKLKVYAALLSSSSPLLLRRHVTDCAVNPSAVIPVFDLFKNRPPGFLAIPVSYEDKFPPLSARNGTIPYRRYHKDSPFG